MFDLIVVLETDYQLFILQIFIMSSFIILFSITSICRNSAAIPSSCFPSLDT